MEMILRDTEHILFYKKTDSTFLLGAHVGQSILVAFSVTINCFIGLKKREMVEMHITAPH